jgi:hypothetical protein
MHIKIGLKKVKICWLGSGIWFWPSIFACFPKAGTRHNKYMLEKSVIKYD